MIENINDLNVGDKVIRVGIEDDTILEVTKLEDGRITLKESEVSYTTFAKDAFPYFQWNFTKLQ